MSAEDWRHNMKREILQSTKDFAIAIGVILAFVGVLALAEYGADALYEKITEILQ